MLRSEHVMARVSRGRVVPHRLQTSDQRVLAIATELCELYATHLGQPRAVLQNALTDREEELGPHLDVRRGFRIVRALAKLLEERANWQPPTAADPYTVRTRLFELAAALPEPPATEPGLLEATTRDDLLSQVASETALADPEFIMFADRQGAQVLSAFDRPEPEALVLRYNVAQVQGVLYAARELVVDLGRDADARLAFHYVKLMGLVYRLETTARGYRLHLDGPLSIFGGTRKYGLRLAKFLPGLLLTAPWTLSAAVEWKGRDATLELDSESGLHSHYLGPRERESQEPDEVRAAFVRAWERAKDTGGWTLDTGAEILPLPELKTALVPDFILTSAGGERTYLEILGFWSERSLIERVALVREARRRGHHVLLAASQSLGASKEILSEAVQGEVVSFKNRLAPKAVLEALDRA